MAKPLYIVYGVFAYLLFFVTFLYAIGFVGNLYVPKSIDSGVQGSLPTSLIGNILLLGLFAIQHSVMARPAFKTWWTTVIPHAMERSTYVLLASLVLVVLFWLWQPLPSPIWRAPPGAATLLLTVLFWVGWGLVLLSTFLINHFELFGLQQSLAASTGRHSAPMQFRTPFLYKVVRHPLYLGFLIAFWATPTMTLGHLVFSIATTVYIFIGASLEERDLTAYFGERYVDYRKRVSMIIPWPPRRR